MPFVGVEPHWRRTGAALAGVMLAAAVAGCSSGERIFGSGPEQASASGPAQGSPSVTSRVADMFLQKPPQQTEAEKQAATLTVAEGVCPAVDVRQGASTLTLPPGNADAFALRYQGSLGELARECTVSGGIMRMKVGIEGRILVGPAGGAGQIEVPLRYAVVREGPEPKTVLSKLSRVQVSIPAGSQNVVFTHVDSDIAFPLPPGLEIEAYVVYVGFDPLAEKAKPTRRQQQPARR